MVLIYLQSMSNCGSTGYINHYIHKITESIIVLVPKSYD